MMELFDFIDVDKNFVPDTSIKHNPAGVPKVRLLNRLFFHPAVIRTAKAVFPEVVQEKLKQVQQQNLKAPPKFPPELRAKLLDIYRDDISKLETLLNRDLSIWLSRA
jgi:hypothetical protein